MLFISVYSKMELTEFDVRFCYAPKLGAKLQQIFEIYKNLAWKCKFICVFLRILICAHELNHLLAGLVVARNLGGPEETE